MCGLRSRELLVAAIAASSMLLVPARSPYSGFRRASSGFYLLNHLLLVSGRSSVHAYESGSVDSHFSIPTVGVELRRRQLLRLSSVLIEQAYFPKAKSILAECVQLSGGLDPEVEAQARLLRWRMGLKHLSLQEIALWLSPNEFPKADQKVASPAPASATYSMATSPLLLVVTASVGLALCMGFQEDAPSCKKAFLVLQNSITSLVHEAKLVASKWMTPTARICKEQPSELSSNDIQSQFAETRRPDMLHESYSDPNMVKACLDPPSLEEERDEAQVTYHKVAHTEHVDPDLPGLIDVSGGADLRKDDGLVAPGAAPDDPLLETLESNVIVKGPILDANAVGCNEATEFASAEESFSDTSSEDLRIFASSSEESFSETLSDAPHEPRLPFNKYPAADIRFLDTVDTCNRTLAVQIRALSKEAFGKDDDATQVKRGERLAVLLRGKEVDEVVCYATYVVRRDLQSLSVNKLAVSHAHQRRGLGRIMLRNLIQVAKRRSRGQLPLDVVCLSSLPTSIPFYKACGFNQKPIVKLRTSSDVIEGQVYMEYRLQRKNNRKEAT